MKKVRRLVCASSPPPRDHSSLTPALSHLLLHHFLSFFLCYVPEIRNPESLRGGTRDLATERVRSLTWLRIVAHDVLYFKCGASPKLLLAGKYLFKKVNNFFQHPPPTKKTIQRLNVPLRIEVPLIQIRLKCNTLSPQDVP